MRRNEPGPTGQSITLLLVILVIMAWFGWLLAQSGLPWATVGG